MQDIYGTNGIVIARIPDDPPPPISPELAAVRQAALEVAARRATARGARAAAAAAPAATLAEEKIALARDIAAAEVEQHDFAMDAVYREACGRLGFDAVARIPTARGSIILRVQSEEEADVMHSMAEAHERGAEKTAAGQALGKKNAVESRNRSLRACVLSPLEHFDATMKRYHMLWGSIWQARNALVDGRVLAEGKDGAP